MNAIKNEKSSIAGIVISKILDYTGLNAANFCAKIGANPNLVYDMKNGKTKRISDEIADKILKVFPEISRIYLVTGEGEMLDADTDRTHKETENTEVPKDDSTVVQMLRDMLREKESKIEELIADNAQLRQQLRNLLCKEDATVESQEQHTSTETEIFTT